MQSSSAPPPPPQPQPQPQPQQSLRREKIIAPAIYFTPASSSVNLHPHPSTANKSYEHMGLAELQSELEHLVKSVSMLLASNSEMQAIDPQHTDPDLTQAIGENVAIILKRNAAISRLRRCISALQPHADHLPSPREQQQQQQQQQQPRNASSATASRAVTFAPPSQTDRNVRTTASAQQNGLYL